MIRPGTAKGHRYSGGAEVKLRPVYALDRVGVGVNSHHIRARSEWPEPSPHVK
jgi:hypothetical protein